MNKTSRILRGVAFFSLALALVDVLGPHVQATDFSSGTFRGHPGRRKFAKPEASKAE